MCTIYNPCNSFVLKGDLAADCLKWWRWSQLGLYQSSSQRQTICPTDISKVALGVSGQCSAQASQATQWHTVS